MNNIPKVLIATTNSAKFNEIKYFLKDLPVQFLNLKDLNIRGNPNEDGKTFEENAVKKASYYYKKSKLPVIADDGGLEIDFLNGEPGVKSKRWIKGKVSSDEKLIEYTLQKMKNLPLKKRGAKLRTVLAFIDDNGSIYTSEGIIKGIIAEKPCQKLTKGYPYRAIFFIEGINKYYSEFDLSKKMYEKYSHRGQALKKIIKIIKETVL